MIRLFLGTLLVTGFMAGCAPEVAEEPSSSVLVDTRSGVTIPEGLTVHDVDHNSDGTIDMDDLVIVGKFFGQNVPETGDLAMASDANNADKYIYALMELSQFDTLEYEVKRYLERQYDQGKEKEVDYPQHWNKELINNELAYLPNIRSNSHTLSSARVRFAFRFLVKTIDGVPNIIEVKVKHVNERMHKFVKKTITQSLDADYPYYLRSDGYLPKTTTDGGEREVYVRISTVNLPEDGYDFRPIKIGKREDGDDIIVGRVTITVLRTNQRVEVYTKDENVANSWPDQIDKSGIKNWSRRRYFHHYQGTHYYLADDPPFGIRYLSDRCDPFHREVCYGSSYMPSDEVKAQYFPEDM